MALRTPVPVGEKFHRLTVVSEAPKREGNNDRRVTAFCECGTLKDYVLTEVRLGKTKSCGCFFRESKKALTHGHTRGGKFSPEYHSWVAMRTRCLNPESTHFTYYGGRGIQICEAWAKFENFLADMGERPEGSSLDRIDVDKGYSPENCRWATRIQQGRNTRHTTLIEFEGVKKPISEWAEQYGLVYNTLIARIHRLKWPIAKALQTPSRPRGPAK